MKTFIVDQGFKHTGSIDIKSKVYRDTFSINMSDDQYVQVVSVLKAGGKISGIKETRILLGIGLREAIKIVEQIMEIES